MNSQFFLLLLIGFLNSTSSLQCWSAASTEPTFNKEIAQPVTCLCGNFCASGHLLVEGQDAYGWYCGCVVNPADATQEIHMCETPGENTFEGIPVMCCEGDLCNGDGEEDDGSSPITTTIFSTTKSATTRSISLIFLLIASVFFLDLCYSFATLNSSNSFRNKK